MCKEEVVGNWYSSCSHFDKRYFSGEEFDCMNKFCALSTKHEHTAENCSCPKEKSEVRRIQNVFRSSRDCPICPAEKTSLEADSLRVGRKPNNEAQYQEFPSGRSRDTDPDVEN